jgi:pre-rRNA-processing protein TSR1
MNIIKNSKVQGLGRESFLFISCDRSDMQKILDYGKVADIICPVLSCKDCKVDKLNLDPYIESNAYDDIGYNLLSLLRL